MEDDLKKKWKTNQSTKINLIGCDTIVNSPSSHLFFLIAVYSHQLKRAIQMKQYYQFPTSNVYLKQVLPGAQQEHTFTTRI